MSISTACPGCGARHEYPDELLHKRVCCATCQANFLVGAGALTATPPPADPTAPAPAEPVEPLVKVVQELIPLEAKPQHPEGPGAAPVPALHARDVVVVPSSADAPVPHGAVSPAPLRPRTPPPLPTPPPRLVVVRDDDAPRRPRRRRRDEWDDDDDEPSSISPGLVIGLVLGGILLLAAGAAAIWLLLPSRMHPADDVFIHDVEFRNDGNPQPGFNPGPPPMNPPMRPPAFRPPVQPQPPIPGRQPWRPGRSR
jgi:hypothetical protein